MIIRELQSNEALPIDLILLADPEEEVIHTYMTRSKCYVGVIDGEIIGIYLLLSTRPNTMEIVNIAVHENFQGKGIGKKLIEHALMTTKDLGYKTLEIGTGNSSIGQLYLYQKCGFRIIGIDKDFFIRHYKDPIFENGLQCKDMIRMQINL
ncbi:GNAT family N-acetyltransferase [Paenibacillus sp. sgz500958]|uniref:GNAT family N-acetyltransferase n=1 Tax=Paenibacillus sp. sgz500958 TaxID=3242475 RepID=UPI0036D215E5